MNRILCFMAAIFIGTVNSQVKRLNMYDCADNSLLEAYAGPCVDTAGCAMPICCGAYAGTSINVTIVYPAKVNAVGGNYVVYITGVTLTTNDNDPFAQVLHLPLSVPTPYLLLAYSNDMCYGGPNQPSNPNFCPQYVGQNYTFSQIYTIPIQVTTSATLVAEFNPVITSGSNTVLCARGYARLMSRAFSILSPIIPL